MNKIKLNFSGKELDFFFGLSFLGYLYKDFKWSVSEIGQQLQDSPHFFLPKLMYESYSFALTKKGEKVLLNEDEFIDLLDDNGGLIKDDGCANVFLSYFMKSLGLDVDLPNTEGSNNDVKKK